MNRLLRNCCAAGAILTLVWSGAALAECKTTQVGVTTFSTCGTPVAEDHIKTYGATSLIKNKANGASPKTNDVPTGNVQNGDVPKFMPSNQ